MDRIKPRLTDMAIALSFPRHIIDVVKKDSNPVYYLLSEWLEGQNRENDSRPLTWATLITALQHAGLLEEVNILEQHFLFMPVATVPQTSERLGLCVSCLCFVMFEIMAALCLSGGFDCWFSAVHVSCAVTVILSCTPKVSDCNVIVSTPP